MFCCDARGYLTSTFTDFQIDKFSFLSQRDRESYSDELWKNQVCLHIGRPKQVIRLTSTKNTLYDKKVFHVYLRSKCKGIVYDVTKSIRQANDQQSHDLDGEWERKVMRGKNSHEWCAGSVNDKTNATSFWVSCWQSFVLSREEKMSDHRYQPVTYIHDLSSADCT